MSLVVEKLIERWDPPWSYAKYMETALYDSETGYYMKKNVKLGIEGDFYTSNHIHPVFQKTFARFFSDIFKKETINPCLCEWGGGDGRFAYNVLSYFQKEEPEIYKDLQFIIIEASPVHQKLIMEVNEAFKEKIMIFSELNDAKEITEVFEGIIFSNELVDAFPVHVVEQRSDGLHEACLTYSDEGNLTEEFLPCKNNQLQEWIKHYGPELPVGSRTEVSLAMKNWLTEVSQWLKKGLVVTVDYGYTNEELIQPERRDGSLRGYFKHQLINDPLMHPGEMDITSHVQWDAFKKIASEQGFFSLSHNTQDRFLINAGLFTFLQEVKDVNPFSESYKQNRAIQSLVQPGGISSSFQVDIQSKCINRQSEYKFFTEDPYQLK